MSVIMPRGAVVRTQKRLMHEQAEAIKREAAERGASMAEAIGRCIAAHLGDVHRPSEDELRRGAASIVGMIKDGLVGMSRRHDDDSAEGQKT